MLSVSAASAGPAGIESMFALRLRLGWRCCGRAALGLRGADWPPRLTRWCHAAVHRFDRRTRERRVRVAPRLTCRAPKWNRSAVRCEIVDTIHDGDSGVTHWSKVRCFWRFA